MRYMRYIFDLFPRLMVWAMEAPQRAETWPGLLAAFVLAAPAATVGLFAMVVAFYVAMWPMRQLSRLNLEIVATFLALSKIADFVRKMSRF